MVQVKGFCGRLRMALLLSGMVLAGPAAAAPDGVFPGCAPTNGQTIRLPVDDKDMMEFVWVEQLQAWIGKRMVTHGEFHLFQPRHISSEDYSDAVDRGKKPVSNVSFTDAADYAAWVNARVRGFLPSNAVVSLPRDSDLYFFRSRDLWAGEDQLYAWLKCYGLNCPAAPTGPFLTIKNHAGIDVYEQNTDASKTSSLKGAIVFDTQRHEWTTGSGRGLQAVSGPPLIQMLQEKASIRYSDNTIIDTSVAGALLGFRLVIRQ